MEQTTEQQQQQSSEASTTTSQTTTTPLDTSSSSVAKNMPQTPEEKIKVAQALKEEGTALFKQKEYKKALSKYKYIFLYVNGLEQHLGDVFAKNAAGESAEAAKPSKALTPVQKDLKDIRITAHNNIAQCYLILNQTDKALENCKEVLKLDPDNIKALFRSAQANINRKFYDKAKENLEKIIKLCGDKTDKSVYAELERIKKFEKLETEKQKKDFARMFQ